ncbi:MAG: patatin-like phospholipase family protein [Spirochaetes bacterium]|nr:patatin-like phospholipase family protein [Spirochaetota bacterium]
MQKVIQNTISIFILIFLSNLLYAQNTVKNRPKVGLVLSGGGAKGLAHIGVLKVLEREGIQIDYITGTSMGALVGGLYAIGYSAEDLEKIILNQDWNDLLTDKISRTDRTIDSRKNLERYIVSFPFNGKEISLPRGAVSGQKVSELLTELTVSVHQQNDFSKFPIPFKCIATDIETGMPVVLDKGYLPDALRASMSIPTVYTPVEINGKLLLDGGLTRNLPAEDLKKMGADIIIGIDVNNMLLSKKDLKDFTLITEQTLTISMMDVNNKQRKICDLIIDPDMTGFNTGSFNKIKKIIESGEKAAIANIDAIKKLVGDIPVENKKKLQEYEREIVIDSIETIGQVKLSEEFIIRKSNIKIDRKVNYADIQDGMEKIYGTGYFERVTYQVVNTGNKNNLQIRVVEKGTDFVNVGLRYDSEQKASLLFNLTVKNLLSQNSTLLLDAHLGENPRLAGSFLFPVDFLSFFAIETNTWYHKFPVYIYQNDEKIVDYDSTIFAGNINLQTYTFYNFIFGLGTEIESLGLKVNISNDIEFSNDSEFYFWNEYVFFKYDSMDQVYFPSRGLNIYSECKYVYDLTSKKTDTHTDNDSIRVYGIMNAAIPFHKRISLHLDVTAGAIFGDNIPVNYLFYFGGMNNIEDRVFEFAGMKYMQVYGNYCQMVSGGLQFNLFDIYYFTPAIQTLRIQNYSSSIDLNPIQDIIFGFSLKAGVLTPLGPIETAVSAGKNFKEPLFSFYMGYAF